MYCIGVGPGGADCAKTPNLNCLFIDRSGKEKGERLEKPRHGSIYYNVFYQRPDHLLLLYNNHVQFTDHKAKKLPQLYWNRIA